MPDIRDLKKQVRRAYQSLVSLYCPALTETVHFTSSGFNHLLYESNRTPRKISEQYMKLMCFQHVPDVIAHCTKISEVRTLKRKDKGIWKTATCYELVYEVEPGKEIQVILERVGNGKLHFLSVMRHNRRPKTQKRPVRRS